MDNIRIRIPLTVSQQQQTIPLGVQAGGGGMGNYNALANKPAINGHKLVGDQTAAELGLATPEDIPDVPTKTSDLTNDSGFINAAGAAAAAPVQSVNSKTGAVTLDAEDVGALPAGSTQINGVTLVGNKSFEDLGELTITNVELQSIINDQYNLVFGGG